jgi:hypothetical protein
MEGVLIIYKNNIVSFQILETKLPENKKVTVRQPKWYFKSWQFIGFKCAHNS